MASRRISFAPQEWFHCYTRGVEGRTTFEEPADYSRFMQSLYLCNSTELVRRDDMERKTLFDIFSHSRTETLVDVGAYCLMPNHFHVLMRAKEDGDLSRFMQKLMTSYTMYFNISRKHVGPIFVGPFRAKHVSGDRYFKRVAQYIHLNPIELYEPGWKSGTARLRLAVIERRLKSYPYSSLPDYQNQKSARIEKNILDKDAASLLKESVPPLSAILQDAALYYGSLR